MKVEVNRELLEKALIRSCSVARFKNSLPILFENLFKFSQRKLEITATNLEITIVVSAPYDLIEGKERDIVVDGNSILRVISLLKSEIIWIELQESKFVFGSNKGRKRYELPINYKAESFPKIQAIDVESEGINVRGDILANAFKITAPIANPADLRPAFTGVFIGAKKGVFRTAAVDHMSIALAESDLNDKSIEMKPVIITKNSAMILALFDKSMSVNIVVSKDAKNIIFNDGSIKLYSNPIDVTFPPIDTIISQINLNQSFICDKVELIQSIKRCLVMSKKETQTIKIEVVDKVLKINAEDIDFSKSSMEEIDLKESTVERASEEKGSAIGLDGSKVGSFINNLEGSENVVVFCKERNKPLLFTKEEKGTDGLAVKFVMTPILLNSASK